MKPVFIAVLTGLSACLCISCGITKTGYAITSYQEYEYPPFDGYGQSYHPVVLFVNEQPSDTSNKKYWLKNNFLKQLPPAKNNTLLQQFFELKTPALSYRDSTFGNIVYYEQVLLYRPFQIGNVLWRIEKVRLRGVKIKRSCPDSEWTTDYTVAPKRIEYLYTDPAEVCRYLELKDTIVPRVYLR